MKKIIHLQSPSKLFPFLFHHQIWWIKVSLQNLSYGREDEGITSFLLTLHWMMTTDILSPLFHAPYPYPCLAGCDWPQVAQCEWQPLAPGWAPSSWAHQTPAMLLLLMMDHLCTAVSLSKVPAPQHAAPKRLLPGTLGGASSGGLGGFPLLQEAARNCHLLLNQLSQFKDLSR